MTIFQTVGQTAPSVEDSLRKKDGSAFDLSGATVYWRLRPMFGTALVVDHLATIVGAATLGQVRYDWTAGDAAAITAGPYRGWWHIVLPDTSTIDTSESTVVWQAHVTTLLYGPATDWCDASDILAQCPSAVDGVCLASAASMASAVLYELSGARFLGYSQAKVRPCRTRHGGIFGPQILQGSGHIVWGRDGWRDEMGDTCGCVPVPSIALAGWPVTSVSEVLINGTVLDPSAYRLDGHRDLVRTDGTWWPICQNIAAPATADGTWQVTYEFGTPPPELGVRAAAQLGCEFYKACAGQDCRLPTGVTSVQRQGVSVQRSALAMWAGAGTGLELVDAFLVAYGGRRPATIWSPDLSYPRRVD